MKTSIIFYISILVIFVLNGITFPEKKTMSESNWPELKGPYLGQKTPGMIPEIFAPGIISTKYREGCSGWGKNMEYFIFQRAINKKSALYVTYKSNDLWLEPVPLTSINEYRIGDFTITPDGQRMVFASKKIIEEIGPESNGANLWLVNFNRSGWSKPQPLGANINTIYHDSYPSVSSNGNMYFFSRKPGGFGDSDIYMTKFIDGSYQKPINLGGQINTKYDEWDSYIAPDESYMIYCSTKAGGLGKDDLYINFRQTDGTWCKPVHMGNKINSSNSENRPYVSPDGQYLFYAGVNKGNRKIYWVSAKIIEQLKPETIK